MDVLRVWPGYLRVLLRELKRCDVVHVRCPSNIGLLTILLLAMRRTPRRRWIKYAGNWRPGSSESPSYAIQRWLLARGAARAVVTVNGRWPGEAPHVLPFLNPCLTDEELHEGALIGATKRLGVPVRLLFVGRMEESKGCGRAVDVVERLRAQGIETRLDLVGDGEGRPALASRIASAGLSASVRILGWVPRPSLNELYRDAHILLFPSSSSEGWPKVLSEGMAYGVVPVASTVSSIPQYLEQFRAGRAIDPMDLDGFVAAIAGYVGEPRRWQEESARAMKAAASFSYESYLSAVRGLFDLEAA
jgi:glycosyltransferase involved in cell wall biosynthesis